MSDIFSRIENNDIEYFLKDGWWSSDLESLRYGSKNYTPLAYAVIKNKPEIVKLFVENGSSPNYIYDAKNNFTLLLYAVFNKNIKLAEFLLDSGADISAKDGRGYSVLTNAVLEDDIEIVELLLEKNAVIDRYALMGSIIMKRNDIFELFVQRNAKLDIASIDRMALDYLATSLIRDGNINGIRFLMDSGVNFDGRIYSYFIEAVKSRNINMVNLIMKFGKNKRIDFVKKYGHKALLEAIDGNDIDMVKKLMENGVSVNANNVDTKDNPLTLAIMRGNVEIAKILMEKGARHNISSSNIGKILNHLIAKNHTEMVKFLIDNGTYIDSRYRTRTPLMTAAAMKNTDLVEYLLEHGANVNAIDSSGNSALIYAVSYRDLRTTEAILNHGPDLNIVNNEGRNAIAIAADLGLYEIINAIEERDRVMPIGNRFAPKDDDTVCSYFTKCIINPLSDTDDAVLERFTNLLQRIRIEHSTTPELSQEFQEISMAKPTASILDDKSCENPESLLEELREILLDFDKSDLEYMQEMLKDYGIRSGIDVIFKSRSIFSDSFNINISKEISTAIATKQNEERAAQQQIPTPDNNTRTSRQLSNRSAHSSHSI